MTVLAAASPSAFDQPGTLGFLVVFGLAIVLYFLFRSMAKHLRRVNDTAAADEAWPIQVVATSGRMNCMVS